MRHVVLLVVGCCVFGGGASPAERQWEAQRQAVIASYEGDAACRRDGYATGTRQYWRCRKARAADKDDVFSDLASAVAP